MYLFSFNDADAFARFHDVRDSEYIRLSNMPFSADLIYLDLGDFRLRVATFKNIASDRSSSKVNAVMRAGYKPDRAIIAMPTGKNMNATINGEVIEAGDVIMFSPGASVQNLIHQGHQDWAALDFPAAYFDEMLTGWGVKALPHAESRTLNGTATGPPPALPAALTAAATLARLMPDVIAIEGCIAGIRESIDSLLAHTLMSQHARPPPVETRGREIMRIVDGSDQYLRENLSRPIYTEELCAALLISPRKMHDAFISIYGVSPHCYLKCRRLALVRSALVAGRQSGLLVKSIALAHGFWHLGHFAQDYYAMFGEVPSLTLQGSVGAGTVPLLGDIAHPRW
jgi:AraC family ethanolamine operon transcriptional activator